MQFNQRHKTDFSFDSYEVLILLGWPHTSSVNRTPMLFCTGWAYNILTKRKFVGISMLLHPLKRKFAKGHFKGPKRSSFQ